MKRYIHTIRNMTTLAVMLMFCCQLAMADVNDSIFIVTFSTSSCGNPIRCPFRYGDVLTIYADNDTSHIFTGWSDGITANPRTLTVTSDTAFAAQYMTVGSGSGTLHTATISFNGCSTSVVQQYSSYVNLNLTAEPDPHYHFVSWSDGNTENPRLLHLTSDTNLVATVAIDQYTVSLNGSNVFLYGAGTYTWGAQVTITAVPDANYHFVCWSDGDSTATRTFTAEEDVTLTAVVEGDPFTLTTSATNGTVSGAGTYPYNSSVTLTAIPDAHYHFVCWNDGDTNRVRIVTVTQNAAYTAMFAIDQHVVTLPEVNGTVTGAGTYNYGTEIQLTATPDPHYHFVQWSDGVTTATRTITVTEDITLVAIFEGDVMNVTATASANGSVIGGGTFPYGTSVSVVAVPYSHYHFVSWNDGDTTNPRTFILTQDTAFSATIEIDRHTVTATGDHATITGAGEYDYGTEITLTATVDDHCTFVGWSDGNTDNPRQMIVTSDTLLTVIVTVDQVQLTVSAYNGTVEGSGSYDYGTAVTLTVVPDQGYMLYQWSDGNTSNPRTVTLTADTLLIATCKKFYEVKVSTSDEYTVTGAGTYFDGDIAVLEVTSLNENRVFSHWSDYNTDNPRSIVVNSDISLAVVMKDKPTPVENIAEDAVKFILTPNPVGKSEMVTINGEAGEACTITILDAAGNVVGVYEVDALPFEVVAPSVDGTYFIKIESAHQNTILKLIVK